MRGKRFRQCAWLLLLRGFDLLEEVDHRLRIVTAGIEILRSQIVGLRLESARKLHKGKWDSDSGRLVRCVSDAAAYKDQRNGRKVRPVGTSHLPHRVPRANVSNLVGHDASQFRFVVSRQDGSRVHVEEPAWKRER